MPFVQLRKDSTKVQCTHTNASYISNILHSSAPHRCQYPGGIPIGAALYNHVTHTLLGTGSNQRIQKSSPTLHGEMACLESIGRLPARILKQCTMYTTLSPCTMCSGAVILFGIGRVVMGENETFVGGEDLLKEYGVEVVNLGEYFDLLILFTQGIAYQT